MGEYHDLYLKSDILLITDVFENFRKTCLTHYRLDPCHCVSSPGLAWDAMLQMTKINLDLITDTDMQLFIEKGIRGGISYIAHRYAEANNKYMENYNPKIESSYIMYLGCIHYVSYRGGGGGGAEDFRGGSQIFRAKKGRI